MAAVEGKRHIDYAKLSLLLGVVSIGLGGGYWYWQYTQKQHAHSAQKRVVKKQKQRKALGAGAGAGAGLGAASVLHGGLVSAIAPAGSALVSPIASSIPAGAGASVVPPAQTAAVPPPSVAVIKQMQHWLNVINRALGPKDEEWIPEEGSAGPKTAQAVKNFQRSHGMAESGKLDAMTQSLIKNMAAARKDVNLPAATAKYMFKVYWEPSVLGSSLLGEWVGAGHWAVVDSLHFVLEIEGAGDKSQPPNENAVREQLITHYGESSSVGQALRQGKYGAITTQGVFEVDGVQFVGAEPATDFSALSRGCPLGSYWDPLNGVCRSLSVPPAPPPLLLRPW